MASQERIHYFLLTKHARLAPSLALILDFLSGYRKPTKHNNNANCKLQNADQSGFYFLYIISSAHFSDMYPLASSKFSQF